VPVAGVHPRPDCPRPIRGALVTFDAHTGLVAALVATLPRASWQRCRTRYATNLMNVCPKASWGWVKVLLHSVCDQPYAASVHAPFDRIVDALADKLPYAADHLEQARADILAFTAYSKGAVAADLVQQPTGTSSTSASFETTADTNVILRRYATSYMIPGRRPFLAPW
jgi:hypothetical protein